jgi:5,10-methylene-tetrahydrofolate dehydrogenase/methenyl tetrahydrofolate cyclohydrolase
VLLVVQELNLNDAVDGILVQLPLPKGKDKPSAKTKKTGGKTAKR